MEKSPDVKIVLYHYVQDADNKEASDTQQEQLLAWVKKRGYTLVDTYTDKYKPGSNDRKAFDRLMTDAKRQRFNAVLFWKLDHFSREGVLATLTALRQLHEAGVAFRSHTEPYIDSVGVFQDAIISILSTLSHQETIARKPPLRSSLERVKARTRIQTHHASPRLVQTKTDDCTLEQLKTTAS